MGESSYRKISVIGAGNVATHLSVALQAKGFPVAQIYSHSLASAKALAERLGTDYTNDSRQIIADADLYFFAVSDSALPEIGKTLPPLPGLWVHTSGSVPMDVFAEFTDHYSVCYPLQTLSRSREIALDDVPFFVEAHLPEEEAQLMALASRLSSKVLRLSSEQRQQLHLAAVIANNFSNHLYVLAAQILEENHLSFDLIKPLIRETAAKIEYLHPREAQTGPAARGDAAIIEKHLEMLKGKPELQALYRVLSESCTLLQSKSEELNVNNPQ
ncbi:MAG: DUF2520 domain-containing protein [Dysgonamonadaceae bacterium]|jgi:predicted short-subunit dehydrogenase-like oxidoreductase (DUF2520 family)|nr:DUF2520 domain-containing protein [Dysgonamonadaceae bacterium]